MIVVGDERIINEHSTVIHRTAHKRRQQDRGVTNEVVWAKLNPKWGGWSRWAFAFHCIEVQT